MTYVIKPSLFIAYRNAVNKKALKNHGKVWEESEEKYLISRFRKGDSLYKISAEHLQA